MKGDAFEMHMLISLWECLTNEIWVGITEDWGITSSTNQKKELPDS